MVTRDRNRDAEHVPPTKFDSRSDERFPKSWRLRKRPEIQRTLRKGTASVDHCLVVLATRNTLGHNRLGVNIGRRVGNAAVRNRWKRLIREAFRRSRDSVPQGYDIVVRPRKGAVVRPAHDGEDSGRHVCSWQCVQESLRQNLARIHRKLPNGISEE